ncbi:MAG: 50S ribosomal protein L37ae [Nanoarchaeota archaeon]|nr:50S ribosomal protein L37ae [Nanoarchaeota archaeon]
MAKTVFGSTKRFGSRYGRTTKLRFGEIEKEQRRLHKCPYCHKEKVKRISVGIWECRKCSAKFTGKAFTL